MAGSSGWALSSAIPLVCQPSGGSRGTNALDFGLGFWGYGFNDRCWVDNSGNTHCDRFGYSNGTFNMDYLWQSNIVRGQAQLDWHVGVGGRASGGARLLRRLLCDRGARANRASI